MIADRKAVYAGWLTLARHLFLLFGVGCDRALSPTFLRFSFSRVSFQRNRIRLLLFPPEEVAFSRFLRRGTFDTSAVFLARRVITM